MTSYRFVVRHVGYWRGQIHRWSTSYVYSGTADSPPSGADCLKMLQWDDAMCYGGSASESGTYECAVYDMSRKGTHIAIITLFDWKDPGTWVNMAGTAWTTTGVFQDPTRENALVVEWAGGLGATGKPVYFRKWYHAVPVSSTTGAGAQISAADQASLLAHARTAQGIHGDNGLLLQAKSGRIAGEPRVLNYYGNHQMPKGRRKKKVSAAQAGIIGQLITQITNQARDQANDG